MSLSLTKKPEAAPVLAPRWHPDFRNLERLPDTKVVRTNFTINVAAVGLAVLIVGYVAWREYEGHSYVQQAAAAEADVQRNAKQNTELQRLTRVFNDEDRKFAEVSAFVETPLHPSQLLSTLSALLPHEVQLDSLEARPSDAMPRCIVRGLASGSKAQASVVVDSWLRALAADARLSAVFDDVKLNALNPDPRTGAMRFELEMRYRQKGAKKS